MTGKVLNIYDVIEPDKLGCAIANQYVTWEMYRVSKLVEWTEVQRYVYATDTTKTSNSKLPWSNKTTLPKLTQIRDNLFANYMASMFPKRKWLIWEGASDEDDMKMKVIEEYMAWVIDRNEFYDEVSKLVLDYIDYGNAIATVEWINNTSITEDGKEKVGYVGPMLRRISPIDIVLNPVSSSFSMSPKIVRSLVSIGEIKELLESGARDAEELGDAKKIWSYMREIRERSADHSGDVSSKDDIFQIAGFNSYRSYLESNVVEVLTFYGDIFNDETGEFLKNQIIKVVDRHKIISKRDNPSYFGMAPIYHAGWRIRPDNLWAMGPLDNLVGMQYRIDHLENMKADVFDLIAYPPLKIRGYVEDFDWGPFERMYVGDDGDVELMSPDVNALNADNQIAILEMKMEEMAGSPKEAMGFRTPGEKTAYEVQRLENAASRIFQNKIAQFERQMIEPLLNAMLELARRNMDATTIRVWDTDAKIAVFETLTPQDITGNGRLKPIAARHFAEQAQIVQNLTNFFQSAIANDPEIKMHFSTLKTARLMEQVLDIEDYDIVEPFVRIAEQADAQRMLQSAQEQLMIEQQTPAGLVPGDHDADIVEEEPIGQTAPIMAEQ